MTRNFVVRVVAMIAIVFGLSASVAVRAQDAAQQPAANGPADKPKEVPLEINQQVLAKRFEQFQNTLLQMAEQMRKTDPDRAELIFRALSKSQEDRVSGQMKVIEELLTKKQFGSAIGRQDDLTKSLFALLELLQSENRLNEIDAERKRIEALLKDVNKLIGKEKDARAATERGADADKAAGQQKDVSDETKKVAEKIDKQDAQKRAEQDGKNSKSPQGDAQSQDGKQSDGKQSDSKDPKKSDGKSSDGKASESKDGQSKDGQKKDGSKDGQDPKDGNKKESDDKDSPKSRVQKNDKPEQNGEPSKNSDGRKQEGQQGQPMPGQQGQPMPGQQQQQQQQQKTPGREDLEQAREEMQRAIEDLKKLDRDKASRHQDEAIKRLLEAKEKFEEILRQLREEEKKLTLTALEARFRKMLSQQLLVYNDTITLAKTGKKDDPTFEAKSKQLARNEDEIVVEAEKALVLLKSEGSSVAFPDAAEAIRDDMTTIVQRLDRADPGELTQTIERNVIEALEEMIDALQKELEKQKDKDKQQQQQQQQGQPEDDPLVDALAELKMLRSLQLRINRQTKQLGRLIEGEQAKEPEVVEQLQTLSRRQAKIQQATYDLATGRNK